MSPDSPAAPRGRTKKSVLEHVHSFLWLLGVLGLVAGWGFLTYVPSLKPIARSHFFSTTFQLVGGLVIVWSLYGMGGWRIARRLARQWGLDKRTKFDFGWNPGWMHGLGIAAVMALAAAVALLELSHEWWPLALELTFLAAILLAGNRILRQFHRVDQAVLPMVNLVRRETDLVLDAGCGAGRATIAVSRIIRNGKIVALDRFDAAYIEDGGLDLLHRNLKLAGLRASLIDEVESDRVRIETGDLAALPFKEGIFDSAVSTHVFDRLGAKKTTALGEVHRVLKPGGRFLVTVWVPGWTTFCVINVLCVFLPTKRKWRKLVMQSGFKLMAEGVFDGTWYMLLEKPAE